MDPATTPQRNDQSDSSNIASLTLESTNIPSITSKPTLEDSYSTNNPRMGVALIFNQKVVEGANNRDGTEKDGISLQQTLSAYGFEVRHHLDLTIAEVTAVVEMTAAEDHSDCNCFLMVVMTHGMSKGQIHAKDNVYSVEQLWEPFFGDKCKSLINKPKLFFIQACRGEKIDSPVIVTFIPMSQELNMPDLPPPMTIHVIPRSADLLVMYSSFEDHYSYRCKNKGSWFIQTLCEVLNSAAVKDPHGRTPEAFEINRLLTVVNRHVAYDYQTKEERKQMPTVVSTLTKTFYLIPNKQTVQANDKKNV